MRRHSSSNNPPPQHVAAAAAAPAADNGAYPTQRRYQEEQQQRRRSNLFRDDDVEEGNMNEDPESGSVGVGGMLVSGNVGDPLAPSSPLDHLNHRYRKHPGDSNGNGSRVNLSHGHDPYGYSAAAAAERAAGEGGSGLAPLLKPIPSVPGRPARRRMNRGGGPPGSGGGPGGALARRKHKRRKGFWDRFYAAWIRPAARTCGSLFVAVLLWYALGVVSIGTSKVLLTSTNTDTGPFGGHHNHVGGVPPLFLTLQQLLIGMFLLRFLAVTKMAGLTLGIQSWPSSTTTELRRLSLQQQQQKIIGGRDDIFFSKRSLQSIFDEVKDIHPCLMSAACFFAFGFLATNAGFSSAPASFVETIKASEPITSAAIAVAWGIEVLSREEVASLAAIIAGVLLSTYGNAEASNLDESTSTFSDSFKACVIVMASNLCFSFRGLYQKLLRQTPEGDSHNLDDLNLQYRMQQIGVSVLALPVIFVDGPSLLRNLWYLSVEHGLFRTGTLWRYIMLSLVNGFAFAGYNLASTYILSRISVVHHAALNCIRRIFAIIVTSILFRVPITVTGVVGIVFSFVGFMAFSHYKVRRQTKPKQLSSLLPVSAASPENNEEESGIVGVDDGIVIGHRDR